jgi:nucleoside-diphosphate-sugar epimerase
MSEPGAPRTLVTGGAGYLGIPTVRQLIEAGHVPVVLDSLLHGQVELAAELEAAGVELIRGDVRDADARAAALAGAANVVHLAAIVGDPACKADPETARAVNLDATRALIAEAAAGGVRRFVFASTCSNYGRMTDPAIPIDEDGVLAPLSLYAETKVEIERELLGAPPGGLVPTCLRFATLYGVAPRMRFDLTVNEFTRELWADRTLDVFGEQFWRPYVHVADAARGIRAVLEAPEDVAGHRVFNVGRTDENYRKADLVELIRAQTPSGRVEFVRRDEDPRDYKVGFERVARELGFVPAMTVPEGIGEILAALDAERFGDPFDDRHKNIA